MLCKDCKVEMEKGIMDKCLWVEKELSGLVKMLTRGFPGIRWKRVNAYHCPNCKKIELYTEDTK